MRISIFCLPALLAAATGAHAEPQSDIACPQLPADAGLVWQHKATPTSDFCRALREDGSEAFGLFIANESPFKPSRGNRAEEAVIDGREVQWYRSEIAAKPDVKARETLIKLPDGRVAHLWVQAATQQQLDEAFSQTSNLRFRNAQLSSN